MYHFYEEFIDDNVSVTRYQPVKLELICMYKVLFKILERTKCTFLEVLNEPHLKFPNDDERITKFFIEFCSMPDSLTLLRDTSIEMANFTLNFMHALRHRWRKWIFTLNRQFQRVFFQRYGVSTDARSFLCPDLPLYGYLPLFICDEGRKQVCKIYTLTPITVEKLKQIYLAPGKRKCPGDLLNIFQKWRISEQKWQKSLPYRSPRVHTFDNKWKLPDNFIINCSVVRVYCNFKKQWY